MDDLGNRSGNNTIAGSTVNYTVGASHNNQYSSVGGNSLAYDAAGNLTTDENNYDYTYDYENRVIEIKNPNNDVIAQYAYDALGRRIRKIDTVASETTLYYNNYNWQVLAECDGSNNCLRYFVYGNYIDEPLMMVDVNASPDEDYYYVHDHLYSPAALLADDGTIAERYEYDAYGNMTRLNPNFTTFSGTEAGNPYYFTGRTLDVLDGENSLEIMYYRYRYYKPSIGRFMQNDPLDYEDSMNLYEYVLSKPTLLTDSYGSQAISSVQPHVAIPHLVKQGFTTKEIALMLGLTVAYVASQIECPPKPNTGDCTASQHATLQAEVDRACKNSGKRGCKKGMKLSSKELMIRATKNVACMHARRAINNTCFRGGDKEHQDELQKAVDGARKCLDLWIEQYK